MKNKYKTRLEFGWFYGPLISLNRYLVEYKGVKYDKWLISGYSLGFKLKDWKIESFHSYYDGNNCAWQLGPFQITRFGHSGECKGCRSDR